MTRLHKFKKLLTEYVKQFEERKDSLQKELGEKFNPESVLEFEEYRDLMSQLFVCNTGLEVFIEVEETLKEEDVVALAKLADEKIKSLMTEIDFNFNKLMSSEDYTRFTFWVGLRELITSEYRLVDYCPTS